MAIYDCFQYFNEDHVLDLRFNILNEKVDYFVISESTKTHQDRKKLNLSLIILINSNIRSNILLHYLRKK